jgi:hypothetical protein
MWSDPLDFSALIEGGAEGLRTMATVLRNAGFAVHGIYAIKLVADDTGHVDWVVRIIVPEGSDQRAIVVACIKLRQQGKFPIMHSKFRFNAIGERHPEVQRIARIAHERNALPKIIEYELVDGMLIEYAVVADLQGFVAMAA